MRKELLILPQQLSLTSKPLYTVKVHRRLYNMATATHVHLSTSDAGVFSHNPREDSAKRASELLQRDMKEHHIFFNEKRFHSMTMVIPEDRLLKLLLTDSLCLQIT
jgi:hypothetical protein